MKRLAIEALALSPFYYVAAKLGFKNSKDFLERNPKFSRYRYLVEYVAMMISIAAIVFVLFFWHGGGSGGDDSGE